MNNSTITELEKLKQTLLDKVAIIEQAILLYKSMSQSDLALNEVVPVVKLAQVPASSKYSSYKASLNYRQKVATILTVENRFLSVKEIAEIIHSLEPEQDFIEIKKAVGSAKSYMVKDNKIAKYVVGPANSNSFYGSKNWLDENGEPKPEHKYNEEALVTYKEDIEI